MLASCCATGPFSFFLPVAETRDLDENTVLDLDAQGNVCSITVEHASTRADAPQFTYEQIAA